MLPNVWQACFYICTFQDLVHKALLSFFPSFPPLKDHRKPPVSRTKTCARGKFLLCFLLFCLSNLNVKTPTPPQSYIPSDHNSYEQKWAVTQKYLKIILANVLSLASCFPGIAKASSIQGDLSHENSHLSA